MATSAEKTKPEKHIFKLKRLHAVGALSAINPQKPATTKDSGSVLKSVASLVGKTKLKKAFAAT
jgi:hypothetical protein